MPKNVDWTKERIQGIGAWPVAALQFGGRIVQFYPVLVIAFLLAVIFTLILSLADLLKFFFVDWCRFWPCPTLKAPFIILALSCLRLNIFPCYGVAPLCLQLLRHPCAFISHIRPNALVPVTFWYCCQTQKVILFAIPLLCSTYLFKTRQDCKPVA